MLTALLYGLATSSAVVIGAALGTRHVAVDDSEETGERGMAAGGARSGVGRWPRSPTR